MFDLRVRVLGPGDWLVYRAVRLAACREATETLGASVDQEAAAGEDYWRAQLAAARRLVVELDGRVCGVVSVEGLGEEPGSADLSGLWVEPSARSTGVAGRLVEAAVTLAAGEGVNRLYCWVSTENARAIGFATSFGFRVTSRRRPAGGDAFGGGDTEIALVLSLEDDPAAVPDAGAGGLVRRDLGTPPGSR